MNEHYQSLSQRNFQQRLFKLTPQLATGLADRCDRAAINFLNDTLNRNLTHDWTIQWRFLHWLHKQLEYKRSVDEEIIKQVLISTVINWSLLSLDYVEQRGIVIFSALLPNTLVTLLKSQRLEKQNQIFLQACDNPPLEDGFRFLHADASPGMQYDWQKLDVFDSGCLFI